MFLTTGRGIPGDGNNSVLLCGYGGFNISLTPSFSTLMGRPAPSKVSSMPSVNLRGGSEYATRGEPAPNYRKQNVFGDFIAAANGSPPIVHLVIASGDDGWRMVGCWLAR